MVAYVANGSHGGYRSADMGSLDIWENRGIMYSPGVFNWYLVGNCVGEVNLLVDTESRTFCNVTNQLVRGEEQYEPVEGYWPRHFAVGASHDPSAPWHHRDNRWFTTRPEGLHSALEFGVDCPVDLHIYDPLGRHVGINYTTGEPEIQISDAIYLIEDAQYIMIPDPIEGELQG